MIFLNEVEGRKTHRVLKLISLLEITREKYTIPFLSQLSFFFHSSCQWCICKRIMQVILPWVMDPDFHFTDCLLSAVTNALQKFSLYPRAFWLMCFWAKVPIITEFFIQLFWFLSLFRTLNAGFCSSTFCGHRVFYWYVLFLWDFFFSSQ